MNCEKKILQGSNLKKITLGNAKLAYFAGAKSHLTLKFIEYIHDNIIFLYIDEITSYIENSNTQSRGLRFELQL
jgi:hypothetical protein